MSQNINENLILTSSKFIKQKEFWRSRLTDDVRNTKLLAGNEGNTGSSEGAVSQETVIPIPDSLCRSIVKLGKESDMSIYIILLAGLKTLIYHYTGSKDITVISPVYTEFVTHDTMNNYVYIRNCIDHSATFRDLLLKLKQTVLDAYDNQDYPCTRLLESLYGGNIPREQLSGNLSNVICILTNLHGDGVAVREKDKLVFVFTREGESIVGHIIYNPVLYDCRYIEHFSRHFISILEAALPDITEKISQLSFLSKIEKNQLLYNFNRTEVAYPREMTIHQLFEQQVEITPDYIALVHEEIENGLYIAVTYRELNRRAGLLAGHLRAKGVSSDDIVSIMVEQPDKMVTGMLAILKAGGAYLPLNPDFPDKRKRFLFRDSGSSLLVTQEFLLNDGDTSSHLFPDEAVVFVDDESVYSNKGSGGSNDVILTPINKPGDLMYVMYTSGSTGTPKGVALEHGNAVNLIQWFGLRFSLREYFNVLQLTDYCFDPSIEDIFGTLLHGATLFTGNRALVADRNLFCRFVNRNRIHIVNYVPNLLKELLCHDIFLESLEAVICGGERLEDSLKDQILSRGYNLYNNYGPTEITVDALSAKCNQQKVTLGGPIANTRIYILDKHSKLTPVGGIGELCISGDGVARGYLNHPELTGICFVENPLIPGERIYKTGDLARWTPEGNIEFLGRKDYQVKLRGYRIELGEIESRLKKYGDIKEVAVITREDERGEMFLCAYYTAPEEISASILREYLSERLPEYMIPSYFIQLKRMPLTSGGKPDRRLLPAPVIKSGAAYVAPRNSTEKALVGLWSRMLGIEMSGVGIDDNFFELGGHSLKATILASEIHKEFNAKVPLKKIFDTPTVREFAKYIKSTVEDRFISIESAEKKSYYELSSAQKRIYVQQQMVLDSVVYNMPQVLVLEGELDKDKLENSFRELIKRHDSLRTSFEIVDQGPVQKIHPHVNFMIDFFDSTPQQRKDFINKFVQPFDLSIPPPLRVQLLREDETKHVLMMDMHHIITDGVSMELFVREFTVVYSGEELPPLKLQYKDYSEWRLTEHTMNSIAGQRDYWVNYFAGGVPKLKLVPDFPQYSFSNFEGRRIDFIIEEELTRKLYELAQKTGTTLFMVMLASFYVLLFRYTKQQDIVVGTAVTGRKHADLKHIIGMFVNMLALRNHPESNKSFCLFLEEVKQDVLNAFDNQDYQFGDLIIDLNLQGTSNRNPLFDVVFSMDSIDTETDNHESSEDPTQLRITPYELERKISPFDLLLLGKAYKDTISMFLEYSTGLFQPSTAVKLTEHYREILDQVVKNNDIQLREIKMSHGLVEVKADRLLRDEGDFVF